jgi:hypothetical protein
MGDHEVDVAGMLSLMAWRRELDSDSCVVAIEGLLSQLERWQNKLADQIEATRIGEFIDAELGTHSVYRGVAVSNAVAAVVAPFIEGAIRHGCSHLAQSFIVPQASRIHERWRSSEAAFWNPARVARLPKDQPGGISDGFADLLEALGELNRFTPRMLKVLRALFAYRNTAFHNGFEWPIREREQFDRRRQREGWDDWVSWTTTNGQLWIAELSPSFLRECVRLCRQVANWLDELVDDWTKRGWHRPTSTAWNHLIGRES